MRLFAKLQSWPNVRRLASRYVEAGSESWVGSLV